jgi:hypothetical protein
LLPAAVVEETPAANFAEVAELAECLLVRPVLPQQLIQSPLVLEARLIPSAQILFLEPLVLLLAAAAAATATAVKMEALAARVAEHMNPAPAVLRP